MLIRSITPNDYSHLVKLFSEFAEFEKHPDLMTNSLEQMQNEQELINGYVATINDEIVAYVTYFYAYYTWVGKSLYLDDLYVQPNYRSKGIGSKLINKVIEKAKSENCKRLRWQVSNWNSPAIKFYESLGAKISPTENNCDLKIK